MTETKAEIMNEAAAPIVKKVEKKEEARRPFAGVRRRFAPRREREKSEFDQRVINIRRVTRVVAGGRRFSLSAAVVIGDKKGRVGVGLGKAGDTQSAIAKAVRKAKKHLVLVPLTKNHSIPHEVRAKYSSAQVFIRPRTGTSLVAGSALRNVLELAGVRSASAKILSSSKNKLNIAQAAIKALRTIKT